MAQILRRVAVSGLGLTLAAFFAFAGTAHAQGEVTIGGVVEVIGGNSDNGSTGLDRGIFSRINLGYANTLDNGLELSANINYLVNQRSDDTQYAFAPDILSLSVGGGFGTISVGSHAPASCALLPRPIAFVPGGVNATWYSLFTDFDFMNVVFAESNYCGTPTAISYATPSLGGLSAMITYAPNMGASQTTGVASADDDDGNIPDYVSVAGSYSSDIGGMSLSIGGAFQTSGTSRDGSEIDSQSIAGTVGMGGATLGAAWHDNGGDTGYTLAAKYGIGSITPGITYSMVEDDANGEEETALAIGASYAVGGGLTVFAEFMNLESENTPADGGPVDDTLLMGGAIIAF